MAIQRELIDDCVHCGFCLPTCPTYELWGEEMDSPRGRIVLMKELADGGAPSAPLVEHLDRCLGCMACVTACPSGVQYDKLFLDARAEVERRGPRSVRQRLQRRAVFSLFPRPGRLRTLAPFLALGRFVTPLAPRTPVRQMLRRLPERFEAVGEPRGVVALLQGCVQRVFFGDVNAATARVLAAEGFEVHAPRLPRCCGSLQMHAGAESEGLAKETIAALEDYEIVVANSAGCGSGMKDYGHLLRDDPEWAERAGRFSATVRDVSELLAGVEPRAQRRPLELKVAYHDACHLAHAQGVREQPRDLLRSIPGVELVEPAEWQLCCGSAGIYNLMRPGPASELGERKARNLLDTGATVVAAANPGCALQIAAHARKLGTELEVLHPVELLDRSLSAAASAGPRPSAGTSDGTRLRRRER